MISYLDSKGRELIFQQTQPGLKLITFKMQVKMNSVWLWSEMPSYCKKQQVLDLSRTCSTSPGKAARPAKCCGPPRSARARIPIPVRWVSLGTFPNSSKPQFPWSVSWEKTKPIWQGSVRIEWGRVFGKGLAQCQACSKHSINLSWYYSHDWKRTSGFL